MTAPTVADGRVVTTPTRTGRRLIGRDGAVPVGLESFQVIAGSGSNTVANIKSQIKSNRKNVKRRLANRAVRSEMRTRTKRAVVAADSGEGVEDARALAMKKIDKAAKAGVIHKNAAARRKSRLAKRVNSATDAPADA